MDLRRHTVAELASKVAGREISARELTEETLARIDAVNGELNAFVALDADEARKQAAGIDDAHRRRRGRRARWPASPSA